MDPSHDPQEHPEEEQPQEGAGEGVESAYGDAWEKARQGLQSMKDQASQSLDTARQKLKEGLHNSAVDQRERAVAGLRRLSSAVHETGAKLESDGDRTLAEYTHAFAGKLEKAAEYLHEREPSDILPDAEYVARRQTGLVVGGMFVAGLIVARLMRSSGRTAAGAQSESEGEPMLPEPEPGQPSAKESTYIPPSNRFGPSGP